MLVCLYANAQKIVSFLGKGVNGGTTYLMRTVFFV
jgi:hypothetical protein